SSLPPVSVRIGVGIRTMTGISGLLVGRRRSSRGGGRSARASTTANEPSMRSAERRCGRRRRSCPTRPRSTLPPPLRRRSRDPQALMALAVEPRGAQIESSVPARLDRLAWSAWHWRVVVALGVTWILDGLEASLVANLGPTLRDPRALGL